MSYSFNVIASNKADAKAAVAAKFDSVVSQQAIHARDRAAVLANAYAVIDMLADNDALDISVSCNGYVSCQDWSALPSVAELTSASITASAGLVNRAA
jgi:hypothetical protein